MRTARLWHLQMSRLNGTILVCAAMFTSASAVAQSPCEYRVADIITTPSCGFFQSSPVLGAISPNGEYVVGYWSCFGGDERGFIYRTATNQFSVIPMPAGISSLHAFDVSDAGLVVGHMGGIIGDFAFVFDLNTNQYLAQIPPTVNAGSSSLNAINVSGVACGARTISVSPETSNAFLWSAKDGVTDLGVMNGPNSQATDITDNNIVVGWTGGGAISIGTRGFVLQNGQVRILDAVPGGLSSDARAANDIPQVLLRGRFQPQPGSPVRAYLWENGEMTDIGILPGYDNTFARSINHSSVVVGLCGNSGPGPIPAGFLWHAGVMHPLEELVTDTAGLTQLLGITINDRGEILGQARTSILTTVAFVLTPVTRAPGDTNCDQVINMDDLLMVINAWGQQTDSPADTNGDGIVNIHDLLMVIENWTVP